MQDKTKEMSLMECLIDSGSEVSLCTVKMFKEFNIPMKCITKASNTINIITSNSVSQNCIVGTVKINIFLLTKGKNDTVFGQSKNVTFYVADDSIILKSPILGSTFLL